MTQDIGPSLIDNTVNLKLYKHNIFSYVSKHSVFLVFGVMALWSVVCAELISLHCAFEHTELLNLL